MNYEMGHEVKNVKEIKIHKNKGKKKGLSLTFKQGTK